MDFSAHNPRSLNALSLAARTNDVANLRRLLRKVNPNNVDNRGWTCLHEAAYNDSFECLKIILKHRTCRPLVESHEGHTALYVACLNTTSTRCIKYLLENVKDIANYGSREGFTPLHLVSRQGRTDVLQMLIEHGAILNNEDLDGDTPLHEACMAEQPEIVNILLHAGAHPELPDANNVTPLHMACSRGSFESVKYLFPFISEINPVDFNVNTPLMTACHGENEDIIQFLLENGGDPNVQNIYYKMAINLAVERGLVRGFKLLFEATNRDEIKIDFVYTALSASYLNTEIIDTILASDLHPDYFLFTKPWRIETNLQLQQMQCYVGPIQPTKELRAYKTFAPLATFLNIAEYIYQLSVDKFNELFYLFLMKGLLVNSTYKNEMPPLVWLHYCPHAVCFDYVLDLMIKFGCHVDYCSEVFCSIYAIEVLKVKGKPQDGMKNFPDVFYASLQIDPTTLPKLISYSLNCDPGYVLKSADDFGIKDRLSPTIILQLMKMIDSNCEISDYEGIKLYLPTLKHLSRLRVRSVIQQSTTFNSTEQYLNYIENLPLPKQIKCYLRFL